MTSSDPGKPGGSSAPPSISHPDPGDSPQALPPMDFSMFVMSLGSSAMVNLGQIPPPDGDQPHVDLDAAKQIIDILGILEEKTRGNLDASEAKLLASLLYDLRVQYVDAQHKKR